MSEHTKGRLEAFTQESFAGWYALRDQDDLEVGSGDGGFEESDARRLAACWNALEGLTTEQIEAATASRDHELNAARALLREVYEEGNLGMGDEVSLELDNRIRGYLYEDQK